MRVPLAVTNVLEDPKPTTVGGLVEQHNPDLWQRRHLAVLDALVDAARDRGLLLLLDVHRLRAGTRSQQLWYDSAVPETSLVKAWRVLARRYCDAAWNVVAADLFNEPNAASWGGGASSLDWAAAAERVGTEVHAACPRWLLMVEGVGDVAVDGTPAVPHNRSAPGTNLPHNWAENLEGVAHRPLRGLPQHRLVYSPHVYGPSVAPQDYFEGGDFPANLPAIWDGMFGFVRGSAPVVVGEWGGRLTGTDATWQRAFASYLTSRRIGSFYWALNPTSGDTGGLLLDDWRTPHAEKLSLLRGLPGSEAGARHVYRNKT